MRNTVPLSNVQFFWGYSKAESAKYELFGKRWQQNKPCVEPPMLVTACGVAA